MSSRALRLAVLAVAGLLGLLAATGPAAAQDALRVVADKEKPEASHFLITGTVFNDGRREALEVYVTAEALDGRRKVVASGIAYVAGSIPAQRSAPFTAKIPRVPNASSFRVVVSGARFGFGGMAPGSGSGGESP